MWSFLPLITLCVPLPRPPFVEVIHFLKLFKSIPSHYLSLSLPIYDYGQVFLIMVSLIDVALAWYYPINLGNIQWKSINSNLSYFQFNFYDWVLYKGCRNNIWAIMVSFYPYYLIFDCSSFFFFFLNLVFLVCHMFLLLTSLY